MNEWPSAALVMAALCVAARGIVGDGRRPWGPYALAGFLTGCAVGLKLTYAIYALGLLAALAFSGTARESARRVAAFAVFAGAGFLACYGWWGWTLWREFANPFFPYFNGIFESPWWHPRDWFDRNFGPRDWRQWLLFPLYFSHRSTLVSEVGFRDYRLAALMVLALLALAKYRMGGIAKAVLPAAANAAPSRAVPAMDGRVLQLLAIFTLVSYLAWLKLYGIYRYLVPLELVSGALIVACVLYLVPRQPLRHAAVILLACLVVGTTRPGSWGRIDFGHLYFDVAVPELPPRSLVIVGYAHPMAYAIPFFRADARFVSPANNFIAPGEKHRLATTIEQAIRAHDGPLYMLHYREREPQDDATLKYFALAEDDAACQAIASSMSWNAMRLCPLRRIPPPRGFGLARVEEAFRELREPEGPG